MSIQEVKDFWNNRPCNIKHSSSKIGTKKYFDEVEKRRYFVEPHIPKFAEFDLWKNKNVLEIGCGIGTESINFARAGAHLTVIELSETSLELCKKRFEEYELSATFVLANAEDLQNIEFETQFDLIWSFGVIHHTPNPEKVIEGIRKHLKQDGELRLMLYSKISYKLFWAMHEYDRWDMSKIDETIQYYAEAQQGCPVAHTYTFSDVEQLLKDFTIMQMYKDHIFIYDIPNYIQGKYVIDKTWENVSLETLEKLKKELGWHTLIVAHKK